MQLPNEGTEMIFTHTLDGIEPQYKCIIENCIEPWKSSCNFGFRGLQSKIHECWYFGLPWRNHKVETTHTFCTHQDIPICGIESIVNYYIGDQTVLFSGHINEHSLFHCDIKNSWTFWFNWTRAGKINQIFPK